LIIEFLFIHIVCFQLKINKYSISSQLSDQKLFLIAVEHLLQQFVLLTAQCAWRESIHDLEISFLVVLQLNLLVGFYPVVQQLHFLLSRKATGYVRAVWASERETDDFTGLRLVWD
jgi:hypothetical protein